MSEQIYDAEIAPLLKQAADRCLALGLTMVAVVEYASDERGEIRVLPSDSSLAMRIVSIAAHTGQNVDALCINIIRYCRENNIPMDSSMFLSKFGSEISSPAGDTQ